MITTSSNPPASTGGTGGGLTAAQVAAIAQQKAAQAVAPLPTTDDVEAIAAAAVQDRATTSSVGDVAAALATLEAAAATDAELSAAVATLSSTQATDAELAAAVATLNAAMATDAELSAAIATVNAAMATDAELSGAVAVEQARALAAEAVPTKRGLLEVFGHSLQRGGARRQGGDISSRLAARLGAALYDRSVGGAVLTRQEGVAATSTRGGYIHVATQLPRRDVQSAPYVPESDLVALWFGLNDVAVLGPDPATDLLPFRNTLRATIARVRCSAVFDENHASVAYGGTSSRAFVGGLAVGGAYQYLTANGSTITVQVPADFPGGAVDLFFGVGGTNAIGLVTFTVDGVAAGTLDMRGDALPTDYPGLVTSYAGTVKRLTGLAPGAHTIVGTISNITGGIIFDGWGIEAPTPPLVLVPQQFRVANYALWAGWPYPGINDAAVVNLNTVIVALAAEFDASVLAPATDDVIAKNAALFIADGAHLNDQGHALIAARLYDTVKAYMATEPAATYSLRVRSDEDYADPFGLGIPVTTDPRTVGAPAVIGAANLTKYSRVIGTGPIQAVGVTVAASSGNISVGHYPGDHEKPRTVQKPLGPARWTSGAVACPAAGFALIGPPAGGQVHRVQQGDWFAVSADNNVATFVHSGASAVGNGSLDGWAWGEAVHPCPANPGTLASTIAVPVLVGRLD